MNERTDVMTWQDYFMNLAILTSRRSKDPSTQVGACIIDPVTNKILSLGYNGFPRGCDDKEFPWGKHEKKYEDNKYPYVVHAELNAILNATTSLQGSDLYVTHEPCEECMKAIVQAGIKKIFYIYEYKNNSIVRERILKATNIKMIQLDKFRFYMDKVDDREYIRYNDMVFVKSEYSNIFIVLTSRDARDVIGKISSIIFHSELNINDKINIKYQSKARDFSIIKIRDTVIKIYNTNYIHIDLITTRGCVVNNVYVYGHHASDEELKEVILNFYKSKFGEEYE